MGLRQRLSKPQYSVKYGFEAHDSGEKRGSRKITKSMGLRQREAPKLLKVCVSRRILPKIAKHRSALPSLVCTSAESADFVSGALVVSGHCARITVCNRCNAHVFFEIELQTHQKRGLKLGYLP